MRLTEQMIREAADKINEQNRQRILDEMDKFTELMEMVPEKHKENQEVRGLVMLAAQSIHMPFHPKHAEYLKKRYRELVEE